MIRSDQMFRIANAIVLGVKKEDSPVKLTAELSALWDEIAADVAANPEATYYVPMEMPDVEVPAPVEDIAKDVTGMSLVSKAAEERKYTLGPMYVPNRLDAHGEWTDPDELQKAVWGYVRKGDRRIRLQHNRDIVAGEFVEVMTWPYEVTVPMIKDDGTMAERTFPKDTVFLGVVWEDWAWDMVKAGKLRGYSVGGRAQRLEVDLPEPIMKEEGAPVSGPTVGTVHEDTIMGTPGKKRKKKTDQEEDK